MQDELIEELFSAAESVMRTLRPMSEVDWQIEELTLPQLRLLMLLETGSARMTEVARDLDCSLPAATSMVDRLCVKNLVVRVDDPQDRRVVVCELTEAGRKELTKIWSVKKTQLMSVASRMTNDELRIVIDGMRLYVIASER